MYFICATTPSPTPEPDQFSEHLGDEKKKKKFHPLPERKPMKDQVLKSIPDFTKACDRLIHN
jgi:hypothetical protein